MLSNPEREAAYIRNLRCLHFSNNLLHMASRLILATDEKNPCTARDLRQFQL